MFWGKPGGSTECDSPWWIMIRHLYLSHYDDTADDEG
jgi:hypothetical protein